MIPKVFLRAKRTEVFVRAALKVPTDYLGSPGCPNPGRAVQARKEHPSIVG